MRRETDYKPVVARAPTVFAREKDEPYINHALFFFMAMKTEEHWEAQQHLDIWRHFGSETVVIVLDLQQTLNRPARRNRNAHQLTQQPVEAMAAAQKPAKRLGGMAEALAIAGDLGFPAPPAQVTSTLLSPQIPLLFQFVSSAAI